MSLHKLAETVEKIIGDALVESAKSKGNTYGSAMAFFKNGTLPDGGKWGGSVRPKLGFDNAPVVSKEKKKKGKGGDVTYTARLRLAPGKGGGAGAGIDPAASNHLFNMLGTDKKSVRGISEAYHKSLRGHTRGLNEGLRRWLNKPENFLHKIVGWKNREDYVIDDVSFKGIKYEYPMVDPSRRRWPAGRTEIWSPVVADVVMVLRKKG